ncbi:MAG: Cell division protein ftsA [candidate division WS6 bacterium GW2011_GWA2_37_6]|uniref:Cell division protein ftsA n=1 Tax=candidate division WS6 bacterium GW2011_GWA2_37_6 TaxID=1619087 RepID=A0A0G0GWL3_9BACT|nr:MAG: Cell division protein ftsA [candidate division WS6 bacterium GW2011_GWA2_37_6]
MPARVGYPKGLEGLVDEINGPAFAVSQGLILYGSQDEAAGKGVGISVPSSGGGEGIFSKVFGFLKNLVP